MKNVIVTIKLEMEVPDEWAVEKTSDGIDVFNMGNDQYLDLTFQPMVSEDKEGTWTSSLDDEFIDELLDMVVSEDVVYEITEPMMH